MQSSSGAPFRLDIPLIPIKLVSMFRFIAFLVLLVGCGDGLNGPYHVLISECEIDPEACLPGGTVGMGGHSGQGGFGGFAGVGGNAGYGGEAGTGGIAGSGGSGGYSGQGGTAGVGGTGGDGTGGVGGFGGFAEPPCTCNRDCLDGDLCTFDKCIHGVCYHFDYTYIYPWCKEYHK